MRRLLPALLLLAALAAPAVTHAYTPGPYGCNLRWDQCFGDGGVMNKSFACDTNSGTNVLVGSFKPAWDHGEVSGMEFVVELATAGTSLPAWWQVRNTGTCRGNVLAVGVTPPAGASVCQDWSAGQAAGGLGSLQLGTSSGANTIRILGAIAVPPSALAYVVGLQEYFLFTIRITNAKTVGVGSCGGCTTPACINLNLVRLSSQGPVASRSLMGPSNFTDSNIATWQGGGGVSSLLGSGCPAATPVRQQTWSAVKSLYR